MSVGKPGEMAAPEGRGPPLKLEDENFVPLDDMELSVARAAEPAGGL